MASQQILSRRTDAGFDGDDTEHEDDVDLPPIDLPSDPMNIPIPHLFNGDEADDDTSGGGNDDDEISRPLPPAFHEYPVIWRI